MKVFKIKPRGGAETRVTYSWVELGPDARTDLKLHNNAPQEADSGTAWSQLNAKRGQAVKISIDSRDEVKKEAWTGAFL